MEVARPLHASSAMRALLILLLLVAAASAQPARTPFTLPRQLPVTVSLVVPSGGSVTSHEKTEMGDSVAARLVGDETPGLVVEVSDLAGRILWRHDFGFSSSQEGSLIKVSCHPSLPMLLVEYHGYKWNHAHKLLFIEHATARPRVREYSAAKTDILPFLRRQKGFEADYEYWIYPSGFTPRGVTFECILLQKPERKAAHPFAQGQQWFSITATVSDAFKISPTDVSGTH